MMPSTAPVLIEGSWRPSAASATFRATDPSTRRPLADEFPVSDWPDVAAALDAADGAAAALRSMHDADARVADFLTRYADGIEADADAVVALARAETGLPVSPRLRDVELVRTTNQLRQAADAARTGVWRRPIVDTKSGLRSCSAPLGPVWAIGPNNFPLAYNGVAGGDFAAAVAAGNPVIAKAHPLHPATTRRLAEAAHRAAVAAGLPAGTVQLLYHLPPDLGARLIADPRLAAVAFTGSRAGGLALKAAADAAGKLFFGEMSSVNPVVLLPGALAENGDAIAGELAASLLAGAGQFCTKPGLTFLRAGPATERFIAKLSDRVTAAPVGTLFSDAGRTALLNSVAALKGAGAETLTGGTPTGDPAIAVANTLLRVSADRFLADPHALGAEAFGNAGLLVVADDLPQLLAALAALEGNLTGSVYSAADGSEDAACDAVAAVLRPKVGRWLNDKMPTGVAVSPAMNHGGPFPATSQPHFSAVGFPGAIARFTRLECYDHARAHRLPPCLRDTNPTGLLWRQIDGEWTTGDVPPA